MKLIISRKGSDASSGGIPSPMLTDGTLLSVPIPETEGTVRLSELTPRGHDLGRMVEQVSGGRLHRKSRVHLDPDVDYSSVRRVTEWVPAFGQAGAAARHLDRSNVSERDVFLFFGWFREVERVGGVWRYRSGAPDLHVAFGWLEVDKVLWPGKDQPPPSLRCHPHFDGKERAVNRVYVGRRGGVFDRYRPELRLTADGASRSIWHLPIGFLPRGRVPLTYHSAPDRWSVVPGGVQLRSAGRGQEFVLDLDEYSELTPWLSHITQTDVGSVSGTSYGTA